MDSVRIELAALAKALASDQLIVTPGATASTSSELVHRVLNQLEALLAQNDNSALVLFQENAASMGSVLGHASKEFERQICQFDYETALATLRSLRQGYVFPEACNT
jgi:hypothetical protein